MVVLVLYFVDGGVVVKVLLLLGFWLVGWGVV